MPASTNETPPKKLRLVLAKPGFADLLAEEFQNRWSITAKVVSEAAVAISENDQISHLPKLSNIIFARQFLPQASLCESKDLESAVKFILKKIQIMAKRANRQSGRWTLHSYALDNDPALNRAMKLEKAVLGAIKNHEPKLLKRYVSPEIFAENSEKDDILMQIYVPSLESLWFSIAGLAGTDTSPFIAGNQRMRRRAGAPSRSASKLDEAFVQLGRQPLPQESAVDLGAAPGGWTYTLAHYGANVIAIDHGELDLPEKKLPGKIQHLKENGLKYAPAKPVDWLCCDMVIGAKEALTVLKHWLDENWMKHFVVTIKLPQQKPWPAIKASLDLLGAQQHTLWPVLAAKHLYHNRQEITLIGSREKLL